MPQVVTPEELRAAGVKTYPPVATVGVVHGVQVAAEKRARDREAIQEDQIKKLKAELAEARAANADPETGSSSSRVRSRK